MEEVWKDVVGYEGLYQISNLGRIISVARSYIDRTGIKYNKKSNFMNYGIANNGYYSVMIRRNGTAKLSLVHRLLAIAFIPNPNNYSCINHIDGNKLNNSISNLEWCTYSKNNTHAYTVGLKTPCWTGIIGKNHPQSKPIYQLDDNGIIINYFYCTKDAHRQLGFSYKAISNCLRGKQKHAAGFVWKFA